MSGHPCRIPGHDWLAWRDGEPFNPRTLAGVEGPVEAICRRCGIECHIDADGTKQYIPKVM